MSNIVTRSRLSQGYYKIHIFLIKITIIKIRANFNDVLLILINKNYSSQNDYLMTFNVRAILYFEETILATCYLQNTEVGVKSRREYWVLLAVAVVYKHI